MCNIAQIYGIFLKAKESDYLCIATSKRKKNMTNEDKVSKAVELKKSGAYNCAQSVACAFRTEAGVDHETMAAMTSAYGLGMGNMHGTCGALIGAGAVIGLVERDRNRARIAIKDVMEKFEAAQRSHHMPGSERDREWQDAPQLQRLRGRCGRIYPAISFTQMSRIRRIFSVAVLMCLCLVASGKVYTPEEVPNVQVTDSTQYVSNPDGILSAEAMSAINRAISSTRHTSTAEIAVVVVDDIDRDINDFATRLFELWGVGRSGNNNGVLVVIAKDARKAVIRTGYGAEGVLPDVVCSRIIRNDMAPEFRDEHYDEGTVKAVTHITQILTDPEAAAEMRQGADKDKESDFSGAELFAWYLRLCCTVAIVMLILVITAIFIGRKLPEQERWRKLNDLKPVALFACFFGLGLPLIAYIPLVLTMRRVRSRHRDCPNCHHRMKKLDEEHDNYYLTPAQDLRGTSQLHRLRCVAMPQLRRKGCDTVCKSEVKLYRVPRMWSQSVLAGKRPHHLQAHHTGKWSGSADLYVRQLPQIDLQKLCYSQNRGSRSDNNRRRRRSWRRLRRWRNRRRFRRRHDRWRRSIRRVVTQLLTESIV